MTIATSPQYKPDWITIAFMVSLHAAALLAFLPGNFSWPAVGLALFLHWVTGGLGITLGFHRLVSHRSFEAPKWLEYFLIFCGTLACQGGPIDWIGLHRLHHQYSD
jgi:stearoyl-CoA desaturase (delta-9 desaturase)